MIRALIHLPFAALLLLVATATTGAAQDAAYRVGPGDVLDVSILRYEEISGERAVREDGRVALHLLGAVEVAGLTIPQIEERIARRAGEAFQAEPSVVVSMSRYRDVFVTGEVEAPGAYPFRPGLTALKAIALAGGLRRPDAAVEGDGFRILEAQRRAAQAQTRMAAATARIEAIDAELERGTGVAGSEAADPAAGPAADGVADGAAESSQAALVAMRRALVARSVEQAERQARIADEEAQSMRQRRVLIENQRAATDEQVERARDLVERGLSRRERLLELQIEADDYRADELESQAFEARARQTAANAESQVEIERTRFRQDLLADRIDAEEDLAIARADFRANATFLRENGSAVIAPEAGAAPLDPVLEIVRGAGEAAETVAVGPATVLRPDDVLSVRIPLPEVE